MSVIFQFLEWKMLLATGWQACPQQLQNVCQLPVGTSGIKPWGHISWKDTFDCDNDVSIDDYKEIYFPRVVLNLIFFVWSLLDVHGGTAQCRGHARLVRHATCFFLKITRTWTIINI